MSDYLESNESEEEQKPDNSNFDYSKISEELLSFAGIHDILRNIKADQDIILHLTNGQNISGKKVYYDENLGIIAIRSSMTFQRESDIAITGDPNKKGMVPETIVTYTKFRVTLVGGITTFPVVRK